MHTWYTSKIPTFYNPAIVAGLPHVYYTNFRITPPPPPTNQPTTTLAGMEKPVVCLFFLTVTIFYTISLASQ
jgi:hypothetical protein